MPAPAVTRSAGRLHPRNWAPAIRSASVVLLFVIIFLSASALIHGTPWAASATRPQCNNRIDDDGDGKIDYPSDPGCTGRGDKSEVDSVEPPPPPPPQVNLEPVDGGPNYLQQFANPFPPSKFPVGVWLQCVDDQGRIDSDKAVGINLYLLPCHTGSDIYPRIQVNGMNMIDAFPPVGTPGAETMGWMGDDEIDMNQPPDSGCANLQAEENARDSTYPVGGLFWNNFGKGVAFWETNAQAACYVNIPDFPSIDVYWFSDNNACGAGEGGAKPGVVTANNCHVAANYGWLVNRVRSLISPPKSKPVMAFVELGCPHTATGWPCIRTEQFRAAAWHTIIAGAMGVEFFAHSFKSGAGNGTCGSFPDIQRNCAAVKTVLTTLNAQIQDVKDVLYAPRLTSGFTANGNVRALAKFSGGKFYVLAGTAGHIGPVAGGFSIPCVGDATATVLNESRSVPVTDGAWTDTFADPNAVHIYRIDGGSTCGLT
jgi:hypothetical protein